MPHLSALDCNLHCSRYRYLPDLLAMNSCRFSGRGPRPDSVSSVSPLEVVAWRREPASHADQSFAKYILDGLRDGFKIGLAYANANCKSAKRNKQSASSNLSVVDRYIRAELETSRVFGLVDPSVSIVQVSPIGLVPKNHLPGRWRLIIEICSPRLASVNEGIATHLSSLSYVVSMRQRGVSCS